MIPLFIPLGVDFRNSPSECAPTPWNERTPRISCFWVRRFGLGVFHPFSPPLGSTCENSLLNARLRRGMNVLPNFTFLGPAVSSFQPRPRLTILGVKFFR